jgi:hypothetical protein
MYISPWMQACLLPRKWDVCGLIVKPLSVWHEYVLRAAGNPYLCGGKPTPDAASEVMMYVMGGITHGRKLFVDEKYRAHTRAIVAQAIKKHGGEKVDAALSEYVEECLRTPGHKQVQRKPNDPPSKPIAAPTAWVLAEYLCKGDPEKLDAAMDAPYSVACCLFDAGRNARGEDETLISEADEKRIDEKLERMEREKC